MSVEIRINRTNNDKTIDSSVDVLDAATRTLLKRNEI